MNTIAQRITKNQANVNNAMVPSPSTAHQQALVQLDQDTLKRHGISGRVFVTREALALVDIDTALAWFSGPSESITVGQTVDIGNGLQALFGYDGSQPNALCFYVLITVKQA